MYLALFSFDEVPCIWTWCRICTTNRLKSGLRALLKLGWSWNVLTPHLFLYPSSYSNWGKESINSDGQQFYKYQQNEQPYLTPKHWHPPPEMGKSMSLRGTDAQMWGIKPVNVIRLHNGIWTTYISGKTTVM